MRKLASALIITTLLASTGCSKFMGNLRRDLDDSEPYSGPTVGGSWSEHGFMADDMSEGGPFSDRYASVGHSERGPASMDPGEREPGDGWISQDRADANRRDAYRGVELNDDGSPAASFSNNPDMPPPVRRQYKNGARATRADFIDDSHNEGSLWASDGQTNYYFTKNKVRSVGDIISVKIEPGLLKDIGGESKRTLTPQERDREFASAQDRINTDFAAKQADALKSSAAAPQRGPAGEEVKKDESAPQPPMATASDIDPLKSMEVKENDMMMAEIIERYPNGNYKIRATKKVLYRNGTPRMLSLVGIARGSDIGEDDVINSGKLYEYRLEAFR